MRGLYTGNARRENYLPGNRVLDLAAPLGAHAGPATSEVRGIALAHTVGTHVPARPALTGTRSGELRRRRHQTACRGATYGGESRGNKQRPADDAVTRGCPRGRDVELAGVAVVANRRRDVRMWSACPAQQHVGYVTQSLS